MADVYVVFDPVFARVIGVAGRIQGAEIIKTEYATNLADTQHPKPVKDTGNWLNVYRAAYARCQILNHELVYEDD